MSGATIFGDPLWAEALSLANIIFAGIMGIGCVIRFIREPGFCRWLYLVLALVGLYWAGLYLWVFFTPASQINSVWFGQIFVRPAYTFTLAVMASIMVYRWRISRSG